MKKTLAAKISDFEAGFRNPAIKVLAHLAQELDNIGLFDLSSETDYIIGDVQAQPLFIKVTAEEKSVADTILEKVLDFKYWNSQFKEHNPQYPDWTEFDVARNIDTVIASKNINSSIGIKQEFGVNENEFLVFVGSICKSVIEEISRSISNINSKTNSIGNKYYKDYANKFLNEMIELQGLLNVQINYVTKSAKFVESSDSTVALNRFSDNGSLGLAPSIKLADVASLDADAILEKVTEFRGWNYPFQYHNPKYPKWNDFDIAKEIDGIIYGYSNHLASISNPGKEVVSNFLKLISDGVSKSLDKMDVDESNKFYKQRVMDFLLDLDEPQPMQESNSEVGRENTLNTNQVSSELLSIGKELSSFYLWNRQFTSHVNEAVAAAAREIDAFIANTMNVIKDESSKVTRPGFKPTTEEILNWQSNVIRAVKTFLSFAYKNYSKLEDTQWQENADEYLAGLGDRLKRINDIKSIAANSLSTITNPSVKNPVKRELNDYRSTQKTDRETSDERDTELNSSQLGPSVKRAPEARYIIDINHNGVVANDFAIGWLRNHMDPGTYFGLMQVYSKAGPISANTTLEQAVSMTPAGTTVFTDALAQALREKWGQTPEGKKEMDSLIAGLGALNLRLIDIGKTMAERKAEKKDIIKVLREVEPHLMSVVPPGSPTEKSIRGEILKEFNQTNVIADKDGFVSPMQEKDVSGVMLPRIRARIMAILNAAGLK